MSQTPRRARHRGISAALLHTLPLVALILSPSLLPADDSARNTMADAMVRMMDAMGFLGDDAQGADRPVSPGDLAMPDIMPGMGQFGLNHFTQQPWSSALGNPAETFGMDSMLPRMPGMEQMPQQMAQISGMPGWRRTTLEGIWEGREGGLLIVQSPRFRLYSRHGDFIDGLIQQWGERIALYDPREQSARPYEVAQHKGRLVLRDAEGRVYLYRRLWLE